MGVFPPESFMKVSIFRNPILNYGQVHARRNDFNIGFYKDVKGAQCTIELVKARY